MLLSDFDWSHNPRGLHVATAFEVAARLQSLDQPAHGLGEAAGGG